VNGYGSFPSAGGYESYPATGGYGGYSYGNGYGSYYPYPYGNAYGNYYLYGHGYSGHPYGSGNGYGSYGYGGYPSYGSSYGSYAYGGTYPGFVSNSAFTYSGRAFEGIGLQPNAQNMKVAISSPQDQAVIDGASLPLRISTSGFTPRCDLQGKNTQEGQGHYDVYLDSVLINTYCTPTADISMEMVSPGQHLITVVPAQNNDVEVTQNAVSITFRYEPTSPLAPVQPANFGSAPTIKIVSPSPNQTVSGPLDVTVAISGFNLDCDLLGKPDVSGYGHWQLDLDGAPQNGVLSGNLLGFGCTRTFHTSTAGLAGGSIHTLVATLDNDDHTPLPATDQVQVRVR